MAAVVTLAYNLLINAIALYCMKTRFTVWKNQKTRFSKHSGSVATSVWVLALALISLLIETELHLEVALKSTQFL